MSHELIAKELTAAFFCFLWQYPCTNLAQFELSLSFDSLKHQYSQPAAHSSQ
jgi:hypothetical protein